MKKRVSLTDLSDQSVLFNGTAEVSALPRNGLSIEMSDEKTKMVWKIFRRGIVIESVQTLETILTLYEKGTGRARIFSPYGEMETELEEVTIEKSGQAITAGYRMPEGDLFRFRLEGDLDLPFADNETE